MNYECALRKLEPRPVMSVRGRTTIANIAASTGEYLGEVGKYVRKAGGQMTGPPFTRIHEVTAGSEIDLEAGMPVATALPGEGRVQPDELPGGEVAMTVHSGPYEQLPEASKALDEWAVQHGRAAAGPSWSVYCNDPGEIKDPSEWKTEVYKPLAPA